MKVVFLWIALEHMAITKKANATMESMIGEQREVLIQLGADSIVNCLSTDYMKQRLMPIYLWIGLPRLYMIFLLWNRYR